MAQSFLSDRGDSTTSSSSAEPKSFFDWNEEMRAAKEGGAATDNTGSPSASATEPTYLVFGPGTHTITRSESGVKTENTVTIKEGDKLKVAVDENVVITTEQKCSEIFVYDPPVTFRNERVQNQELQERQDQTNEYTQGFQNFARALYNYLMLCNSSMQLNYFGSNSNAYSGNYAGDETGYTTYDAPTAGPESGMYFRYDTPAASRPARMRAQPPAARRP